MVKRLLAKLLGATTIENNDPELYKILAVGRATIPVAKRLFKFSRKNFSNPEIMNLLELVRSQKYQKCYYKCLQTDKLNDYVDTGPIIPLEAIPELTTADIDEIVEIIEDENITNISENIVKEIIEDVHRAPADDIPNIEEAVEEIIEEVLDDIAINAAAEEVVNAINTATPPTITEPTTPPVNDNSEMIRIMTDMERAMMAGFQEMREREPETIVQASVAPEMIDRVVQANIEKLSEVINQSTMLLKKLNAAHTRSINNMVKVSDEILMKVDEKKDRLPVTTRKSTTSNVINEEAVRLNIAKLPPKINAEQMSYMMFGR